MEQKLMFTEKTTIGELVARFPASKQIIEKYGLHCVGCSVNPFESLEDGIKSHGLDESKLGTMLGELNEAYANFTPEKLNPGRPLMITDLAATKLKEIMEKQNAVGQALKITVSPGGCAGYSYGFDLVEKAGDGDVELLENGVRLVLPIETLDMLKGASIDYIETLQGAGFQVANPNATSSCGCGKSFR